MAASLPLPSRFAYSDAAFEIANNAAQMTDQLRFLGEDHRDQLLVIRSAAASLARRQWRKRSYIATTEFASQPLDATDAGRLAPQVAARMRKTVALPAGNHAAQIQESASSAASAEEPRPADARHRLIPNYRD